MQKTYSHSQLSYLSADEKYELGRSLQALVPLESHADWSIDINRSDPTYIIEQQNESRISWLVPVRRSRMSVSPFTFYRGTARIMAHDLSKTPITGLQTQICGDAHLSNFGVYASPERHLVFDLNDFDETLLGPWEWDVKRLAASYIIAGRHNGFTPKESKKITRLAVSSYRETMLKLSIMRLTDIWYSKVDAEDFFNMIPESEVKNSNIKTINKAKTQDHRHSLDRLAEKVNGKYQIKSESPLMVPLRDIPESKELEIINGQFIEEKYSDYIEILPDNVQHLLQNYQVVDFAIKVVGVGSVGTLCSIILLQNPDQNDPLFLQIKQANKSVLEEILPSSKYNLSGRRVVEGQRLMQTVSDIFLGWTTSRYTNNHYYWRQLKDWKGSQNVEKTNSKGMEVYAVLTGRTLARAHARSGDPISISTYMGKSEKFDESITVFAEKYADQTEKDYQIYKGRINDEKLEIRKL